MITLAEAKALAIECADALQGATFASLSQTGEKRWVVEVDHPTHRVSLLVCLKKPHSRFHLNTAPFKKTVTPWTGRLSKVLEGAELGTCALLGNDRILELIFDCGGITYSLVFELFAGQALLLDAQRTIVASTPKKREGKYELPPRGFEDTGEEAACTSGEIESLYLEREGADALLERRESLERALQKKIKRAEGSVARAHAELTEAMTWEEKEHLAQLLKAHFGQLKRGLAQIEVSDWKAEGETVTIPLDPALHPQDQIDQFFKRARKLKKGVPHAEGMLGRREDELAALRESLKRLESLKSEEELEAFAKELGLLPPPQPKREREEPKRRLPYRTFTTESGMTILAGKSDSDGDTLTFRVANGSDYWFHVANYPGSHVVLKCPRGAEPDPESLKDAAVIALYFSKAKKGGGDDITVTQVKHVSKPRGAKAGLVNVSRHKKVFARLDQSRLNRLFARGDK